MSDRIDEPQTAVATAAPPTVDQLVAERLTAAEAANAARQRRGELTKFAILSLILLGTVLVIVLLRPFIFGRIVPAIFAWDKPSNSQPEAATETDTTSTPGGTTQSLPIMTVPGNDEASATAVDTEAEEAETIVEPTAVPSQIYVIQQGDTLNSIARQFNTTVEAIRSANQIDNPDALFAGATLTIPQP